MNIQALDSNGGYEFCIKPFIKVELHNILFNGMSLWDSSSSIISLCQAKYLICKTQSEFQWQQKNACLQFAIKHEWHDYWMCNIQVKKNCVWTCNIYGEILKLLDFILKKAFNYTHYKRNSDRWFPNFCYESWRMQFFRDKVTFS